MLRRVTIHPYSRGDCGGRVCVGSDFGQTREIVQCVGAGGVNFYCLSASQISTMLACNCRFWRSAQLAYLCSTVVANPNIATRLGVVEESLNRFNRWALMPFRSLKQTWHLTLGVAGYHAPGVDEFSRRRTHCHST